MERLDELLEAFQSDPDEGIQEMATELLESIDVIHRTGVTRLAEFLADAGASARQRALADPSVRLLFELYDILPESDAGFIPLTEIE
jgi:hypothetical protein